MSTFDNIIEAYKMKLEKNFAEAVFDLHADMAIRIFVENKDVNGNLGKPYSTKPSIIGDENSPIKFVPKNAKEYIKARNKREADGKKRLKKDESDIRFQAIKNKKNKKGYYGKYFEGGYAEFKAFIKRPAKEVSGNLKSDFANSVREVSPYEYEIVMSKESKDKITGNNFEDFFKVSKSEKQNLLKKIIKGVDDVTASIE